MKFSRKKKSAETNKYLRPKLKLGLALSGGGARGFAHIGAFKAFEESGLRFDCVAGTSVGSIMGAAYAAGISWEEMREYSLTVNTKDLIDNRILKIGSRSSNIERVADKLLHGIEFKDLVIPFKAVAVDLAGGCEVILDEGSVAKAVSASSAVPAVFKPVVLNGRTLVDGGLLNNIPADVTRLMGAEFVVSVDLNHTRGEGTTSAKLWDTLYATWRIMTQTSAYKGEMNSDIMIEPELRIYRSTAINAIDEMIDEGYRATKEKIPEIKFLLGL